MEDNCGEWVEYMGWLVGVTGGWNLWVWLSGGGCS